jgi:hypothetical protein
VQDGQAKGRDRFGLRILGLAGLVALLIPTIAAATPWFGLFGQAAPPAAEKTQAPDPKPESTPRAAAPRKPAAAGSSAMTPIRKPVPPPIVRSVCVRLCDGYSFPVGTLQSAADRPVHEAACAAACPGAATRLYTATSERLDRAIASDRTSYRRLPTAYLYRGRRVAACSCQTDGAVAARLPLRQDQTLRRGDVVVGLNGARVVASAPGPRLEDFRRSAALSPAARARLDGMLDVSRKEAALRSFRQALGLAPDAAPFQTASLSESAPAAGFRSVEVVSSGFGEVGRAVPGFQAIR